MSEISLRLNVIKNEEAELAKLYRDLGRISQDLSNVRAKMASNGASASYITLASKLGKTVTAVDKDRKSTSSLQKVLTEVHSLYTSTEQSVQGLFGQSGEKPNFKSGSEQSVSNQDWTKLIKNIFIAKPYIIPGLIPIVGPTAPTVVLLYFTSGMYKGDRPSFFDYSRTPSASATAEWLGYEKADGNPGITAWAGRAKAEAQNEWGYAGVNAYLGKTKAEAKADAKFMKTTKKKEYKDGKWVEKNRTEFISAEAGAGASASVIAGDTKAGLGSDMLGLDGKAEGSVGTAKAEAKGKFSVTEDGINANVKGEALISAAEGKASGTVNILGIEITGKIGGYAGALGVEGKAGIEDNKFVLEGGAAALFGGSAGVEIGFNEEGWNNFVDFITFWD